MYKWPAWLSLLFFLLCCLKQVWTKKSLKSSSEPAGDCWSDNASAFIKRFCGSGNLTEDRVQILRLDSPAVFFYVCVRVCVVSAWSVIFHITDNVLHFPNYQNGLMRIYFALAVEQTNKCLYVPFWTISLAQSQHEQLGSPHVNRDAPRIADDYFPFLMTRIRTWTVCLNTC